MHGELEIPLKFWAIYWLYISRLLLHILQLVFEYLILHKIGYFSFVVFIVAMKSNAQTISFEIILLYFSTSLKWCIMD